MKQNEVCAQCGCELPDDTDAIQYTVSNSRVCKLHKDELVAYLDRGFTYKEADENHSKDYPKIWTDNQFYKKLGKY